MPVGMNTIARRVGLSLSTSSLPSPFWVAMIFAFLGLILAALLGGFKLVAWHVKTARRESTALPVGFSIHSRAGHVPDPGTLDNGSCDQSCRRCKSPDNHPTARWPRAQCRMLCFGVQNSDADWQHAVKSRLVTWSGYGQAPLVRGAGHGLFTRTDADQI
jgi:hypothetical protein